jgi:hypothetical protein
MNVFWYLLPLLVFSSIWIPELARYYVPGVRISDDVVAHSRANPSDAVLREIEDMRLGDWAGFANDGELIAAAEHLLNGELRLPGSAPWKFTVPFAARDLDLAPLPLQFASLAVPALLLDAYERTGRSEFFVTAQQSIVAFAQYETGAWLPTGFLWDDHATAARIPVLIKFWRLYRTRPDFDPQVARTVLKLLARSGQLLAKPSLYTFRTNHGVMQNLALLYLCISFRQLPGADHGCASAIDRISQQMRYFVNGEGVVLEHSAGYHAFGMELLGMILRCMTLLDRPIPSDWAEKYRKARAYYADLRRPDGTLPMYGDTPSSISAPLVTLVDGTGRATALQRVPDWRPPSPFSLFPVAGHAIWWRGLEKWPDSRQLMQTVATWANFPGHGHKLADEMSVIWWSSGQTWLTNSGYWPYGLWGREHAEGWEGSNAPHLFGEPADSARQTELLAFAQNDEVTVLDLRRRGPASYVARREFVQIGSEVLLVLDHVQDRKPGRSITLWTVDPAIAVTPEASGNAYRLVSGASGLMMSAFFLASAGTEMKTFKGSRDPFAGWVVVGSKPTPSTAFRIDQPSGSSWAASVWVAEKRGASARSPAPEMLEWRSGDRWTVSLPWHRGNAIVQRIDSEILLQRSTGAHDTLRIKLVEAPDLTAQRAFLKSAFGAVESQFGKRYRDLHRYRLKITYVLLAVLALQESAFFLLRSAIRRHWFALRTAANCGWLIMGAWVLFVYLQA